MIDVSYVKVLLKSSKTPIKPIYGPVSKGYSRREQKLHKQNIFIL